ncbi:MAG: tetratricopeptide (TPR) repeat protein [Verrucomicrobiales bacterium]|jgi:tetratricopeptide (TPR) repeat protein
MSRCLLLPFMASAALLAGDSAAQWGPDLEDARDFARRGELEKALEIYLEFPITTALAAKLCRRNPSSLPAIIEAQLNDPGTDRERRLQLELIRGELYFDAGEKELALERFRAAAEALKGENYFPLEEKYVSDSLFWEARRRQMREEFPFLSPMGISVEGFEIQTSSELVSVSLSGLEQEPGSQVLFGVPIGIEAQLSGSVALLGQDSLRGEAAAPGQQLPETEGLANRWKGEGVGEDLTAAADVFRPGPGTEKDNWLMRRFIALEAPEDVAAEFARMREVHLKLPTPDDYALQFAMDYGRYLRADGELEKGLEVVSEFLARVDLQPPLHVYYGYVGYNYPLDSIPEMHPDEFVRAAWLFFKEAGAEDRCVSKFETQVENGYNPAAKPDPRFTRKQGARSRTFSSLSARERAS